MADDVGKKVKVWEPSLLPVLENILADIKKVPEWTESNLRIRLRTTENFDPYSEFYSIDKVTERTVKRLFGTKKIEDYEHLFKLTWTPSEKSFNISFGERSVKDIIVNHLQKYISNERNGNVAITADDNLRIGSFMYK